MSKNTFTDGPTNDDLLGISSYVDAVVSFIKKSDTPVSIAIQGDWGSGKTSIMKMIDNRLPKTGKVRYQSIWFSAWELFIDATDTIALKNVTLTLLQSIIKALSWNDTKTAGTITTELWEKIASTVDAVFETKVGLSGGDITEGLKNSKDAYWLKQYRDTLKNEFSAHGNDKLVIFLDDLDRLDPVRSLTILEGTKVLLEFPNIVFVVAIDKDVIREGCRKKYGLYEVGNRDLAEQYYDKFFQLSFNVPIESYHIWGYLEKGLRGFRFFSRDGLLRWRNELEAIAVLSTGKNPRSMRLLLNSFFVAMSRQPDWDKRDDWYKENKRDAQCVMTFALAAMDRFKRAAFLAVVDSLSMAEELDEPKSHVEGLAKEERLLLEIYHVVERVYNGLGGVARDVVASVASSNGDDVVYDGEQYDASHNYQDELGGRLLSLIREYSNDCGIGQNKNLCVLDAGCGNGDFTRAVWQEDTAMTILGVDLSESQINTARRKWIDYVARNPYANGGCISFEKKAIEEIDDVEQFDIVVSNFAMHWLFPREKAGQGYERLSTALKPGGYMFVQQGCEGGFSGLHGIARQCISELGFLGKYKDLEGQPVKSPDDIVFRKWSPSLEEFESVVGDYFDIVFDDLIVEVLDPSMTLAKNFAVASLLFYNNDSDGSRVLNEFEYKELSNLFLSKCEQGFDASDRNIVAVLKKKENPDTVQ